MSEAKIPVTQGSGAAIAAPATKSAEPEVDEKERLMVTVDELADELADLVITFDDVKRDIGELAGGDDRWARIAALLWPEG